jgi:phosphatidylserine/phosphatidylglycerophosphate/cardiolipin synthase-like enzyme
MSYRFLRRHSTTIAASLVVLFLLVLFLVFRGQSFAEPTPTPVESGISSGWYTTYFTNPKSTKASILRGGPDAALAEAIDAAQYSVDAAVYRLDLWSVRGALLRAHRRGVTVRVVTESDNISAREIKDLEEAGIPVRADGREFLMHHKFVVIDHMEVWTGSMNFTIDGAYRNNNNLIQVRSDQVAQDYVREFDEMFIEDRFGALSRADTPHASVMVNGVPVEVFFAPDDGVAIHIVEILREAEKSIDFMVYAFTSDLLAEVMLARARTGIEVRGVLEHSQISSPGSEFDHLRQAGIEVRLDSNPHTMHHKVIVIDETIVITGSYNFSSSAEEHNDENVLILYDVAVSAEYLLEFNRIFEAASP